MLTLEESNNEISDDNKDNDKISLNFMENDIHEKNIQLMRLKKQRLKLKKKLMRKNIEKNLLQEFQCQKLN